MSQYLLSVWHDDTFEVDFSSDDAQRMFEQVDAFNAEVAGGRHLGVRRWACTRPARPPWSGPPTARCR